MTTVFARAGGSATSGQVSVACSANGQTPSYAFLLTGPKGEERWTVTAGLTGKALVVRNEQEVQEIFQALGAPPGDDAR